MRSIIFTLLLLILGIPSLSSAKNITLSWDQSPDPGVAGYKIYYKAGDQSLPFNGTELPQGASPIVVADPSRNSIDLTLPDDGQVYFFAATAYNSLNVESGYSETVASAWIPLLISPTNAGAVAASVNLVWSRAPANYNVTYTLYYGTDPKLNPAAAGLMAPPSGNTPPLSPAIGLLALLALAGYGISLMKGITGYPLRAGLAVTACLLVFGCGSDGSVTGNSTGGAAPSPLYTEVVPDLTDTQLLLYDLEPGQDYYWKVVAVDDRGNSYPSATHSFKSQ
ncbi:hypothetical protein C2E25_09960 [Geothermobacter hydrogeniphilus]|uniref:Fibronectin type-III domain-containing protein n=1 Tax=Geothermobacter hydrogeniphilus TaxID=1969733 RepID=A0A2K2H9K4_9BACT|nr:fibronectin type III domain-containing protein [Geothermobacter hydrogeniphilus]PNU19986.1 hypothetical protein C2E25_09960 [Geothermobacter hydrogeniphilus]